jgi:glycosyltransferase involved in cell wall biosynthesis
MIASLSLSIVVPTRDSASTLDSALVGLLASDLPRESYELIVVDDASTDGSPIIAARNADTVVRLTGRLSGPAYARNRGAELARGDVIAFVDPDVVVRPDTLRHMLDALAKQPRLAAVSATHDNAPAAMNFVSQYWNLLLHFVERRRSELSKQFAPECVAIRSEALLSVGMYDEWRFAFASLEGLELGQRLHDGGYQVVQNRDLQVTHLKRWNLKSVCREVWNRGVLLSRNLGYQRIRASAPGEVVFALSQALMPALAVLGTVALSAAFTPRDYWLLKGGVFAVGIVLTNLEVHRFYARERGVLFAIATAPLHVLVQGVAGIALSAGWLLRDAVGDRLPDATTQAYSEVGLETWPPVPRQR